MTKELKARLGDHLDSLLQFWWSEYDAFKRMGRDPDDRASAAAALRQYRQVRRDYAALESV